MSTLGQTTMQEQRDYAHLDSHQGVPDRPQPFYPFTVAEDNDLQVASECGLTVAELALDLGRPQHHVYLRLMQLRRSRLGVVGGSTGPDAVDRGVSL